MPIRTIICMNCGIEGEIEIMGLKGDASPAKIFRHLGHNPFSGHMHFRCPACKIVLLVDPMAVLSDGTGPLPSWWPSQETTGRGPIADTLQNGPAFQGMFPH